MTQLYISGRSRQIYTMHQLQDAFKSFWHELDGIKHWNFKIDRPTDAWERFLKALKIEEIDE